MIRRLLALSELMDSVLPGLDPVAPVSLPPFEAVGLVLAQTVVAPRDLPERAVALRSGIAVASLDLVGASPEAPVPLPAPPATVRPGQTMPDGCDAVLDPDAVAAGGPFGEIVQSVEPGAHVRRAGHDLSRGETIALSGATVTPGIALAAAMAGLEAVAVRRVAVALSWPDGAARAWLSARLSALGARLVGDAEAAHLHLLPAPDGPPRLALKPAETAGVLVRDGIVAVELPPRFDGVVGGWCALILPLIASLSGASLCATHPTLARKLVSAVGLSDVALLSLDGGAATPLAVGDIDLATIARANAFSILPPGSEGYAAGSTIPSVRIDRPFGPASNPSDLP